jgi:hypothetical protein
MTRWTLLALAAGLLLAAAPAQAKTYEVAGKQKAIDADAGKYRMTGGLLGKWDTTSFTETATAPYYTGTGTEEFRGCIDRRRDRSCAGDPKGTLSFEFTFWGAFGADDSEIWGACWHPIVVGTGDLAGAQGVLTFVDTPTATGLKTRYIGNVTLGGATAARASASRRHVC